MINEKLIILHTITSLELIWTGVPAITLTILVVFGLKYWFQFTGDAPKEFPGDRNYRPPVWLGNKVSGKRWNIRKKKLQAY